MTVLRFIVLHRLLIANEIRITHDTNSKSALPVLRRHGCSDNRPVQDRFLENGTVNLENSSTDE